MATDETQAAKPPVPWLLYAMLLLVSAILAAVIFEAPVIGRINDQAFARGLITFIISGSTIGLAFVLVYQAFAVGVTQDQFRLGREIFTGLMGVLGTIVGFYFGSADRAIQKLDVAEIRVEGKQLVTHVTGGSRPYRYSISSSETGVVGVKDKISPDGWISEPLTVIPKTGIITVDVIDSRDLKGSGEYKFGSATPQASLTPSPTPTTTLQSPPSR